MLSTICFSLAGGALSVAQMLGALLKALLLVAVIFGAFSAVVCCWAIIQQLLIGGALIALLGLATFPRSKVVQQ